MDDTIRIIGASSHPALTARICDYIGVKPTRTQVVRFSNENLMVKIEENVRETDAFVVQTANTPVSEGIGIGAQFPGHIRHDPAFGGKDDRQDRGLFRRQALRRRDYRHSQRPQHFLAASVSFMRACNRGHPATNGCPLQLCS